ncbi:MAG: DNA polymerase III subunit alpha, partial [Quisquiliibacterium sp.]
SFDDPLAYQVLKDANTTAIFQVEGEGMKKLLKKLQPDRFEDIIAVLALYRPGPLGSGMVDDFILRKKGEQRIDFFHPDLQACLAPTYGVIVYQEQVMQIAQIIGGYTLGGADLLRRAMGKKKPEEMAEHRSIFVEGAQNKGYDTGLANKLFDLMAMFAEYGFNKSHTAAYAVVTYQTAWLKAHYPAEFFAATASADMDDTDKVQLFVADAKGNGVQVLPPDINQSQLRFEPVADRAIRYGLGAIKGTGAAAVANIVQSREDGPYKDLFDFCGRIDRRLVNRRAVEALVRAGAFDCTGSDRATLLANVGKAIEAADAKEAAANQVGLFDGDDGTSDAPIEWQTAAPWNDRQLLQEEKSALGYFLSGHLFSGFEPEVRRFVRARLADLQPAPQPQWIAGIAASQRTQMTRRGKMNIIMLDDASGTHEVSVYNEVFERYRPLIREDELLVIQVKVSRDDYSGGLRVVAERILDLTGARQEFGKRLRITLNGVAQAGRLRQAIEPFVAAAQSESQAMPVVVEYMNAQGSCTVELGENWRVRPQDDLLLEVRELLHARLVAVEY